MYTPDSSISEDDAEKKLKARYDKRLLLPLTCLYFLCYMDRANLANAKTDISDALSLSTSQYGLASSIFQVGYMVCEVPANLVLKRTQPSLWLGLLVTAFGLVATATIYARNFTDLMLIRVFLGVAEAGFPPGCLYYLSFWYKEKELGQRNAIYLVAAPLASAFGAIIAYVVLQMNVWELSGWQWLFLLEGSPAILLGILTVLYLPDHPSTCNWLSMEEKALAAKRIPLHAKDSAKTGHNWRHILLLLISPVMWSFALLNVIVNIAAYGISAFLPAIIEEMGYSNLEANLRTAPVYLFMAIFNIVVATLSDRYGERGWVIVGCLAASGAGMFCLAGSIAFNWPLHLQYALCFCLVFYSVTSPIMIAWLQKAYRGSSDAAVGPAIVITIGSVGGFVGPSIYGTTSDDGSSYVPGHLVMGVVFMSGAVLTILMRLSFVENSMGRLILRPNLARWLPCGEKEDQIDVTVQEEAPLLKENGQRTEDYNFGERIELEGGMKGKTAKERENLSYGSVYCSSETSYGSSSA